MMKICVLLFVAAVWMQLPTEGNARLGKEDNEPALRFAPASRLTESSKRHMIDIAKRCCSPKSRSVGNSFAAEMSKRNVLERAKRSTFKRDDSSEENYDAEIKEFLESAEVQEFLSNNGLSMALIDLIVDNDDEIPAEHKDLMKAVLILTLAGVDINDPKIWESSEEDNNEI